MQKNIQKLIEKVQKKHTIRGNDRLPRNVRVIALKQLELWVQNTIFAWFLPSENVS